MEHVWSAGNQHSASELSKVVGVLNFGLAIILTTLVGQRHHTIESRSLSDSLGLESTIP